MKNPKTDKKAEKGSKADKSQKVTKSTAARTQALSERRARLVNFYRDTKSELKKVTWPTKDQVIRLTAVVIALSLVVGILLGGIDFVFSSLYRLVPPF